MKSKDESQSVKDNTSGRARVFLVDDHPALRQGIASLIAASADLELCGEAGTAAEAMKMIPAERVDAAVVDLMLPGVGGLELIRDLRARYPKMAILVFSMHDECYYAERVLRAGAQGYLMKQADSTRVLDGLRAILRGELFVSEKLQKTMLSTFLTPGARSANKRGVDRLSNRELQVFEALGRGRTTLQIAEDLHLSAKTVETYRSNIKRKLGLENGHQLLHTSIRWVEQGTTSETPAS
jgi:DNA-binding NarL/FixJ family response regulator